MNLIQTFISVVFIMAFLTLAFLAMWYIALPLLLLGVVVWIVKRVPYPGDSTRTAPSASAKCD